MKVQKINKLKRKKDIEFPILMESIIDKSVVLFTYYNAGILLYSGTQTSTVLRKGFYYSEWVTCLDSKSWKPFTGEIILENEDNSEGD